MAKDATVQVYDNSMDWLNQAAIIKQDGEFKFTEGAFWHPDQYFLFSDTPANKIYRIDINGSVSIYFDKSGLYDEKNVSELSHQIGSNGLAVDKNDNLLICQHGNHAIAILNKEKEISTLIKGYNGIPFNSPNDIIVKSDGSIFFTDPPYGLLNETLNPGRFQPVGGIYKYDFNKVELIGSELKYPNGLFFSADEQYLFVSSNHPDQRCITRYKLLNDGTAVYDGVFLEQNADGMTTDKQHNIYMATGDGVLIVSPAGKKLALISLPETPSNCCWGGTQDEILFVTADKSVYFVVKP
jgi:gluconolactonase